MRPRAGLFVNGAARATLGGLAVDAAINVACAPVAAFQVRRVSSLDFQLLD